MGEQVEGLEGQIITVFILRKKHIDAHGWLFSEKYEEKVFGSPHRRAGGAALRGNDFVSEGFNAADGGAAVFHRNSLPGGVIRTCKVRDGV